MTKPLHRIVAECGELPTKKERAAYLAKERDPTVRFLFELTYTDRYTVLVSEEEFPEYRRAPGKFNGGYLYANWRMLNVFLKGRGYDNMSQQARLRTLKMFLESMDGEDAELIEMILRRKRFPKIDITIVREAFPELNIVGGART